MQAKKNRTHAVVGAIFWVYAVRVRACVVVSACPGAVSR